MRVFCAGERAAVAPVFVMFVAPAGDTEFTKGDIPASWVDENKVPVQFTVEFKFGRAEVPDDIGKYMVARKLAKRTQLLLPNGH